MYYSPILAVLSILVIFIIFFTCFKLKKLKKRDEHKLAILFNQIEEARKIGKEYASNSETLARQENYTQLAITNTCLKLVNIDFTLKEIFKFL